MTSDHWFSCALCAYEDARICRSDRAKATFDASVDQTEVRNTLASERRDLPIRVPVVTRSSSAWHARFTSPLLIGLVQSARAGPSVARRPSMTSLRGRRHDPIRGKSWRRTILFAGSGARRTSSSRLRRSRVRTRRVRRRKADGKQSRTAGMPAQCRRGMGAVRVGEDATGSRAQGDLPDGAVLFIR